MMAMRGSNHLLGKSKYQAFQPIFKSKQIQSFQKRNYAEDSKSESEKLFETIFGSSDSSKKSATPNSNFEAPADKQETIGKMNYIFSTVFGSKDRATSSTSSGDSREEDPLRLDDLKYVDYYPKTVKKWIEDAKTPPGYYDWLGIWRTVSPLSEISEYDTDPPTVIRLVGKGETRTFRKMYAPPARERLEPDLIDVYRFGLAKEDVAGLSPKLKQVLSFRLAPDREIKKYRVERESSKWASFDGDTGSSAVQIVRLTFDINSLLEHTGKFKKDQPAKRILQLKIKRRRRLMQYLKYKDVKTYYEILKEYLLEDVKGSVTKWNQC